MNKKMNRRFASCLLAVTSFCLLTLMAAPTTVSAGNNLNFTVVNDTGNEIKELYISPNNSDDWGDDVMGKDSIPVGGEQDIVFNKADSKIKTWDIKIVWNNDAFRYWRNFDLSTISTITLHYKNGKATATWK